MVKYLVETGADVHARTTGELQTPIHFASRNDAVNSLKMLIKCGANMSDLDYKNRSPLHVRLTFLIASLKHDIINLNSD